MTKQLWYQGWFLMYWWLHQWGRNKQSKKDLNQCDHYWSLFVTKTVINTTFFDLEVN